MSIFYLSSTQQETHPERLSTSKFFLKIFSEALRKFLKKIEAKRRRLTGISEGCVISDVEERCILLLKMDMEEKRKEKKRKSQTGVFDVPGFSPGWKKFFGLGKCIEALCGGGLWVLFREVYSK